MTPAEITILCLVYVASLVLAQRGSAFVVPDQQEIAFLVAAVICGSIAGYMYYGRERRPAGKGVIFSAAAPLAVLALVVGMMTQLLWQPFVSPAISLTVGALIALIAPFLLFWIGRRIAGEQHNHEPVGITNVIMTAVFAIAAVIAAGMLPAPGHSSVRLDEQTFPGVTISLPARWQAEEKSVGFSNGSVRLADPAGGDHFVSVRWVESAQVQPDDDIRGVATVMGMEQKDRALTNVGDGHEGVTFTLESPDHQGQAFATIWYCGPDRRMCRVVTKLLTPHASMLATHQAIVGSVHCHVSEGRASTQPQAVFPSFIPPSGFRPDPAGGSLAFAGSRGQSIVFYPAVPGRHPLIDALVSPDQVATMLRSSGSLSSIDSVSQATRAGDLLGHDRRVWSASGTGPQGKVQVEVMVWWCDRRDMTFLAAYTSPDKHEPREGVNAMLPAVCHKE
jgi:hypothetical protein